MTGGYAGNFCTGVGKLPCMPAFAGHAAMNTRNVRSSFFIAPSWPVDGALFSLHGCALLPAANEYIAPLVEYPRIIFWTLRSATDATPCMRGLPWLAGRSAARAQNRDHLQIARL